MSTNDVTYFFTDEDDTLGSLLRDKLLGDSNVIFAAYKVPYPLNREMQLRVKTFDTDANSVINKSLNELVVEVSDLEKIFEESIGSQTNNRGTIL